MSVYLQGVCVHLSVYLLTPHFVKPGSCVCCNSRRRTRTLQRNSARDDLEEYLNGLANDIYDLELNVVLGYLPWHSFSNGRALIERNWTSNCCLVEMSRGELLAILSIEGSI